MRTRDGQAPGDDERRMALTSVYTAGELTGLAPAHRPYRSLSLALIG